MDPLKPKFKILFICTGNSARSIFAEYLLKRMAPLRFEPHSAGANPKRAPHPFTLEVLRETYQIAAEDARSKPMEEFKDQEFDFVITLCDYAREVCPSWPGQPIIAHWGTPNPADFYGDAVAKRHFFWRISQQINRRLELLTSLPFDKLDALRLDAATKEIGTCEKIEIEKTPAS
ncbi:MAG: arsenate reductase ArsC [Chthoniobacterales bacterium]